MKAYHSSLRIQSQVAENRIRFSQRLNEMSDELLALAREGEKLRKLVSPPLHLCFCTLTSSTKRTVSDIRISYKRVR